MRWFFKKTTDVAEKKTEQGVKRTRETWWGKVTQLFDRSGFDDELWDELEELLVSADVGVSTTGKLIDRVKQRVEKEKIKEPAQVRDVLKQELVSLLSVGIGKGPASSQNGKLNVILVVGVNGVGKTTNIAKLAHDLKSQGKRVLLAAGDTFRAAAIDQLKIWGDRVQVPVIAHRPGGDPAAVVYDALETAKKNADFVIVDTAGRIHTKTNLMEELKKIRRVVDKAGVEPEVLLVLDATTGQNGLSQARYFTEAVNVDGILLAKLDSTAKGGIVLAICDELQIPILYLGTGQELEDLAPFYPDDFVEALFVREDQAGRS
ncbi:MAG: signal recognition particle-docking protein FtsY [Dehalococcoidia bacterium]|nr:signal recognition particle-docking protein FtsY [Dehalococcoidia bacterium]